MIPGISSALPVTIPDLPVDGGRSVDEYIAQDHQPADL